MMSYHIFHLLHVQKNQYLTRILSMRCCLAINYANLWYDACNANSQPRTSSHATMATTIFATKGLDTARAALSAIGPDFATRRRDLYATHRLPRIARS